MHGERRPPTGHGTGSAVVAIGCSGIASVRPLPCQFGPAGSVPRCGKADLEVRSLAATGHLKAPQGGLAATAMAPSVRFSQCVRRSVGVSGPRQRQRHRYLSMGGASDTARVAALLTKGRVEGWLMNRYGGVGVRSLDAAAWIHDEMLRSPGRLGDHIGWKVGVDGADSALFPGEENPPGVRYCAPIFSASSVASGSTVTHARGGMRGVEVELGFVLGKA